MGKRSLRPILNVQKFMPMKKYRFSILICLLLGLNLQAQLGIQRGLSPLQSTIFQVDVQRPAFSSIIMYSLTYLETSSIYQITQEEAPVVLPSLPQPKIKFLETPRPFIIQYEDYPLWQNINRRIAPVDIPVWKAISITKDL